MASVKKSEEDYRGYTIICAQDGYLISCPWTPGALVYEHSLSRAEKIEEAREWIDQRIEHQALYAD